jgi:hypothetical protein
MDLYKLYSYLILHHRSIVHSGEGVGGILSVIGSGLASGPALGYQQNDVVAPAPDKLVSILMTDSNEQLLNTCMDNLGAASFPVSKVGLGLLDWSKRVQKGMQDQFDFIIGCNCAQDFSALAKVVAYSLKRSPQDGIGSFIHIGPGNHAGVIGLNNELQRKHRLNTVVKDLVLERIELVPFINEDAQASLSMDYGNVESGKFSVLVGYHDEAKKVEKVCALICPINCIFIFLA